MFKLTDKELEEIKDFMNTHKCKLRTDAYGIKNERYVGAIGGNTTYCFTPTGLGTITIAKCACGKEINITDYGSW